MNEETLTKRYKKIERKLIAKEKKLFKKQKIYIFDVNRLIIFRHIHSNKFHLFFHFYIKMK